MIDQGGFHADSEQRLHVACDLGKAVVAGGRATRLIDHRWQVRGHLLQALRSHAATLALAMHAPIAEGVHQHERQQGQRGRHQPAQGGRRGRVSRLVRQPGRADRLAFVRGQLRHGPLEHRDDVGAGGHGGQHRRVVDSGRRSDYQRLAPIVAQRGLDLSKIGDHGIDQARAQQWQGVVDGGGGQQLHARCLFGQRPDQRQRVGTGHGASAQRLQTQHRRCIPAPHDDLWQLHVGRTGHPPRRQLRARPAQQCLDVGRHRSLGDGGGWQWLHLQWSLRAQQLQVLRAEPARLALLAGGQRRAVGGPGNAQRRPAIRSGGQGRQQQAGHDRGGGTQASGVHDGHPLLAGGMNGRAAVPLPLTLAARGRGAMKKVVETPR